MLGIDRFAWVRLAGAVVADIAWYTSGLEGALDVLLVVLGTETESLHCRLNELEEKEDDN